MKKKMISILMTAAIIAASFIFPFEAFAKMQELILNLEMSTVIDGSEDQAWFTFTPDESGTYSFLSYVTPACEAYLFVKETDPATGAKKYVQLAYAINDPNYLENGHNNRQFCLTYYLQKGVKYYYTAGWFLEDRTSGTMRVKLRCDSYSSNIDHIEVDCPVQLSAFIDGSWYKDTQGSSYFFYNTSKLISNTKITIYYKDATTSTVIGKDEIDGYRVQFLHTQSQTHWYPQNNPSYTANTFTVKILDQEVSFDVPIISTSMYQTKLKVVDVNGNPIANAAVNSSGGLIARTDANGLFLYSLPAGIQVLTISCTNSIDRNVTVVIDAASSVNDFTATPIELINVDFIKDGVINAKDFTVIHKTLTGSNKAEKTSLFRKCINHTKKDYPPLTLQKSI